MKPPSRDAYSIGPIKVDEQTPGFSHDKRRKFATPSRNQSTGRDTIPKNSIVSEQMDRLRKMQITDITKSKVKERSFSIQPQYRSNVKGRLEFSRESNVGERQVSNDQYIKDGLDASIYSTGLNQSIYSRRNESRNRETSMDQNSIGSMSKRVPFGPPQYIKEVHGDCDSMLANNQSPIKVPGIMMDSINS